MRAIGASMATRAHVIFHGRVQGVWFRATTRDAAVKEGVTGWVRNLPDGTVEAVFEGRDEAVASVLVACRGFASPIRVDSMDVRKEEARGGLSGFDIRY
jgi:acylphosphatase